MHCKFFSIVGCYCKQIDFQFSNNSIAACLTNSLSLAFYFFILSIPVALSFMVWYLAVLTDYSIDLKSQNVALNRQFGSIFNQSSVTQDTSDSFFLFPFLPVVRRLKYKFPFSFYLSAIC
jgi:hypothetical protein